MGRGDFELKSVRNSASVLQCHSGVPPNDREGMLPISFCTPMIWRGVRGDVLRSLRRIARAMSSGPATFDDLVAILSTHATAAELSQ